MSESELKKNIKIIFKSAELVYKVKDYTSATILYFKTLFLILDLHILKTQGKIPKDHTERFRMLEISESDYYKFLDKNFKIYRSTYNISIDKKDCEVVKKYVYELIKNEKLDI